MLSYLRVENFAVVEKVEISFSPGLNVFTGETGAGKSILVDAISLFLKPRIAENAIRNGKDQLIVEAQFSGGDEEFIFRREMGRRKTLSFLNGDLIPFEKLKEKALALLTIYGQSEHVFLLNPANHGLYLDQFARSQELLNELAGVTQQLKRASKELDELRQKSKEANEKLDFISFQISEIDGLEMKKGDDEQVEQRYKILTSAEEILSSANRLVDDFYQKEESIYNTIADLQKDIRFLQGIYPEISAFGEEIDRFYRLLPELSATLSNMIGGVEYDEEELSKIENTLSRLNQLKARYRLSLDELLERREALTRERETLLNLEFSVQDREKEIEKLLVRYKELNSTLREKRRQKAVDLSRVIKDELSRLEMEKARFVVRCEEIEPTVQNVSDRGTDRIEFYFTSNPGQEPARIQDVASGGEMSRLMLVLKSLADDRRLSTYIFDEIDSGIGGKTAEFVGEKLRKIAAVNQVICISHLPQIASFADRHFLINKEFKDDRTFSSTRELNDEERVSEIARLMAGSAVNEDVYKAAHNLLQKRKV
jgi:DNA repair protein RecN (Recombination protein N)